MLYLWKDKTKTIHALVFGFLFGFFNLTGMFLVDGNGVENNQYLIILIGTSVLTAILAEIYLRLQVVLNKGRMKSEEKYKNIFSDKQYFWLCVLVLCLSYLPVFFAYYPGLFAYDVDTQIPQYVYGYNKHHNLIHTLYLHFFYYLIGGELFNDYTSGIACASVVQMLIFAMQIAYIHLFMKKKQIDLRVRIVLILLTAFLPFFSIMSISMTKDVLFTGFVGMLSVCFYYWEMDASYFYKIEHQLLYVLALIGTILFRNNGGYAVIFAFAAGVFLIVYRKRNVRFIWCTMIGIVISMILSSGMTKALSAENGSQNEMLSIPYQQMAYVYNSESLTEEEKAEIEFFLPDVEKYKAHISDPIKANAQGVYHKKELVKCYLKLFVKYPIEFVEAFLMNNLGYFYLGDTTHAEIYGSDLEERSGYLLTDTKKGFEVEHHTKFAALENLYENLFSANDYQKVFPIAVLCSPASYFWIVILFAFFAMDFHALCGVQYAFVLGLILTVLAGPCALIRYAMPYIICLPALGVSVLKKEKML